MSLSLEIAKFLLVAGVYIVFTFAWGWYKGREDESANRSEEPVTGGEA